MEESQPSKDTKNTKENEGIKTLSETINKEFKESNEKEIKDTTRNISEFKLIKEKTQKVVDEKPEST